VAVEVRGDTENTVLSLISDRCSRGRHCSRGAFTERFELQ